MERDRIYLLDILEAARLAIAYVEDITVEAFLQDIQCQDAVIRRIEIIGEAARRVSPESRVALPALPWSSMIGMRNFLIHDYDDIDLQVVWQTVHRDLPHLLTLIEPLVPPEKP